MPKRRPIADRTPGGRERVRIIGGTHRGRVIEFLPLSGLRPTPDRIRETLFNWLRTILPGADCLDLFAGSGVLGLEAASRGARRVVLVDHAAEAAARIARYIAQFELHGVSVHCGDALAWLRGPAQGFDVVFLDPPFSSDLLEPCCQLLDRGGWLKPAARIYLEMDRHRPLPSLPPGWRVIREKKAGQVCYYLCLSDLIDDHASADLPGCGRSD
ncbi:MAG: 16S rRNA (guanine(966)-N(2))-methyltransferase RsmD [Gammaproteobacteria bacterium]|nr:16S rRNA (guanine(966)-N(2))-methyltransferase RsmD [Gammaproteobacteria bacterium]